MKPTAAMSAQAAACRARLVTRRVSGVPLMTSLLPKSHDLRIEAICRPGDQQRYDIGDRIWWNGHELGVERCVSETGDYGRNEQGQAGKGR